MRYGKLKELTAKELKSWYDGLREDGIGCCSLCYASDDKNNYAVCMGWRNTGDGWRNIGDGWAIAWKIGRQPLNGAMQCDMDVDFEMPYDPETGEADWTGHEIGPDADWKRLAKEMKAEARRVWKEYGRAA